MQHNLATAGKVIEVNHNTESIKNSIYANVSSGDLENCINSFLLVLSKSLTGETIDKEELKKLAGKGAGCMLGITSQMRLFNYFQIKFLLLASGEDMYACARHLPVVCNKGNEIKYLF